jgi:uncharacterized protein with GYD domain
MPRFVTLVKWTEEGIRDVKQTTQRAEQVRRLAEEMGGRLDVILWTLGRYDLVAVTDLPDEETAAAMALRVVSQGRVRTEVLRAFDAEEMGRILQKLA